MAFSLSILLKSSAEISMHGMWEEKIMGGSVKVRLRFVGVGFWL
jgi:hypothetical protein